MKKALLIWLLVCLFSIVGRLFAADYYADPTATSSTNVGTYTNPFRTMAAINAFSFSSGDDLRFRVGTTFTGGSLTIDWTGTESNHVVIGAYYGNGLFGLGGYSRPTIDGQNIYPSTTDPGLIEVRNQAGYVDVENLHVTNSGGVGIRIVYLYANPQPTTDHNTVKNCVVSNSSRQGILIARGSYNLVENNTVYSTSRDCSGTVPGSCDGAGIEITGMEAEVSNYNTVRGNTLYDTNETIGIYKGARYTTVEENYIYDYGRVGIYYANCRDSVTRNNIIYEPLVATTHWDGANRDAAISFVSECHITSIVSRVPYNHNHEVYGNRIAGARSGIYIDNPTQCPTYGVYPQNIDIHDNRFIDCDANFRFIRADANWVVGIDDNYSFIFSNDIDYLGVEIAHTNLMSPDGVTWSGNYYNTTYAPISGNASTTAHLNTVSLINAQSLNFRELVNGDILTDGSDFLFTGESTTPDTCTSNGYVCCDTPDGGAALYPTYDSTCPSGESCASACSTPSSSLPYMDTSNNYGGVLYTPIVLLPFFDGVTDGTSTTLANDLSVYGNNATLTNPNWATDGLIVGSTGQLVAVPISDLNGINAYTVVIVFTSTQQSALTEYGKFFHYNFPDVRGFQLERNVDDLTWLSDIGGEGYSATLTVQDQFDQTPHVAILAVNDSENRRTLFQDGAYIVQSSTAFVNPTYNGYLYLGGKGDGTRIAGLKFHLFALYVGEMTLADAQILQQNPYQMIANLDRDWESNTTPQPSTTNYRRTTFSTNRSIVTRMER